MIITENVFILIMIMAYGSFFYNYLRGPRGTKGVGLYLFSTFWFIIVALTSVPVENQAIGLISLPFAIISAAFALTGAAGEMEM